MKMALLTMKITKKKQKRFLYQHINGVIIVDAYVVKYVLGRKEQYSHNAHILMAEDLAQNTQDSVEREDHRRYTHTDKVERVKMTKIYEAKKELFEEGKKGSSTNEAVLEKEINIMSELKKKILADMQKIKKVLSIE